MIKQTEFTLPSFRRGYHLISTHIASHIPDLPECGLVNIFIKHTSCAICINENADPDVRTDFETFMNRLVPDGDRSFIHTIEGSDDMAAHIKSSIFGQSLTVPVKNGRLALGTWQGIYLCEFRNNGGPRSLVITLYA
jgi:secondary thiamine-phosphate synthase enzyme